MCGFHCVEVFFSVKLVFEMSHALLLLLLGSGLRCEVLFYPELLLQNSKSVVFLAASLLAYFSRFGEVTECVVVMNPTTGKSRGFGFVTFADPACVETVQAAAPHILDGKQVCLDIGLVLH